MRTERDFMTIPREFDIKPRDTLVGKILLLQHSALGVQMNWHTCLVSSRLFSGAIIVEQRKAFTTAIMSQDFPDIATLFFGVVQFPKLREVAQL
jgi:hypothetical protein